MAPRPSVTPHPDAGSSRVQAKGNVFCRYLPQPVFLDSASQRGMTCVSPRTPMRGPAKCLLGEFSFARIPEYRVVARYDVRVTPHPDAGSRDNLQQ